MRDRIEAWWDRHWRSVILGAFVIIFVTGSFGMWQLREAVRDIDATTNALDQTNRVQNIDRQASRRASCIQDNVQAKKNRAGFISNAVVLISQVTTPPTPEQQRRIDRYIRAQTEQSVLLYPYRDCSPAGLRDYYAHPPPDPALEKSQSKGTN